MDGDGDVERDDFVAFAGCFTGPGMFYTPDDACSVSDADGVVLYVRRIEAGVQ